MKYIKLFEYFELQEKDKITLLFSDIEKIIGFDLPASAYKYSAYWSNDYKTHSISRTWMDAGYKSSNVDIVNKQITFDKM